MNLICPNDLLIETALIYAKALRIIILTDDHEKAFFEVSKEIYEDGSTKLK